VQKCRVGSAQQIIMGTGGTARLSYALSGSTVLTAVSGSTVLTALSPSTSLRIDSAEGTPLCFLAERAM